MKSEYRDLSVDELVDKIKKLEAHAQGRTMKDAERVRWNDLNDAVEELREHKIRRDRITELAKNPDNVESEDQQVARYASRLPRVRHYRPPHLEGVRGDALRQLERRSAELSSAAADRVERLVDESVAGASQGFEARYVAAVGDEDYASAFGHLLSGDPSTAHLRMAPAELEALQRVQRIVSEQRTLGLGSQGGSYPVPLTLDPTVILTSSGVANPLRKIARKVDIVTSIWNGVASSGMTAAYGAESAAVTDGSPTLTQPSGQVEKAQAFAEFSIEVFDDWSNLQGEFTKMLTDAKDTLEATKFLRGLGHSSSEPQGLIAPGGATAVVTSASTALMAAGDLYSVTQTLPERWQPNASIVANRAVLNTIRGFDTYGGAQLWVQLGDATPSRLLDYPTYNYSAMASTPTTSGATVLTVGDFSQFVVIDRLGMNVELVQHTISTSTGYPTGSRGIFCYWRNTSLVTASSAFVSLKLR